MSCLFRWKTEMGEKNMYKVLLVDDEYFPREALKMTIPWEKYGCVVCGEAKNGFDGIEKAIDLKPDIVLADINMPFMDGLDMIMNLQKVLPDILYSIVTGYSEFEYAKRGIDLGVEHFILKPVDDEEMIKTVQHMVKILDERREKEREYERLRFWAEKNSEENRRFFLDMLLFGEKEMTEQQFLDECMQFHMPLKENGYGVCCLKIDSRTYVEYTLDEWQNTIADVMGRIRDSWEYTVYYRGNQDLYIIFNNVRKEEWSAAEVSAILQKIQLSLMNQWVCTVLAGFGGYCETYRELSRSRAEAESSVQEISVSKLISDTLHYIHEHYGDPDLSLKGIAENLFVNYSYLSGQFTKEMGMTVSQYILRFRMTKAADALRNGADNMVEIACSVGYVDVKYFYRCFIKEFGITPYQYIGVLSESGKQGKTL